jgi:hypothetical protein
MEHRFELDGVRYYQQGRKCGKPGCTCTTGQLHGPYWYARDLYTGTVAYVGRDLPEEVINAYTHHQQLLPEMNKRRRELLRQYDAIGRLLKCEKLIEGDQVILELFGFGEALVHNNHAGVTQEN